MSGKEKRGKRRRTNGEGGGKNDDDDDFLKRIRNENKLTNINSLIVTWRMKKTQLSHTQDTKCKLCRIEINYGFPGKEKKGLRCKHPRDVRGVLLSSYQVRFFLPFPSSHPPTPQLYSNECKNRRGKKRELSIAHARTTRKNSRTNRMPKNE